MAFDVGSVVAHVKADVSDFKKGINDAKHEVNGFSNGLASMGGVLKTALIAGSAAAAVGVAFLGKSALDAAADFEQTKISFETMLGSASKAQKLLKELQEFAKKTPFNLGELQEGSKRLLAYGVSAEKLIPTLKVMGDIASGVGKDKLPDLIRAFGQVQAKGKLMAQELNQFAEAGVPLREMLAKDLKMSVEEFSTELDKGNLDIKFSQVEQSLAGLTQEGGRFNDMMEKQSKSFSGSLSNLQDSWHQLLVVLGTGFIPIATQAVQTLTGFLTPIMQVIQGTLSWEQALRNAGIQTEGFKTVLTEFNSFLNETLLPAINVFIEWFKAHWTELSLMFNGTWQIMLGIVQIAWSLIYGLLKVGLELLAGDWKGAWQAILQMTEGVWGGLKTLFNGALNFIKGWAGMVFGSLVQPFEDAWGKIQDLVRKIKDALDFTKRHSPSVVDIVNRGVGLVNNALEKLDMPNIAPHASMMFTPTVGTGGGSINSINIDLSSAVISDDYGAQRIGERIGDSIIKKLQNNVKF